MGASIEQKAGYTEGFEAGVGAVLQGLVVGPADRLVIVLPADTSASDAEGLGRMIQTAGPGWRDRILVVAGAEGLAVLKGGGTDGCPAWHRLGDDVITCAGKAGHGVHRDEYGRRWAHCSADGQLFHLADEVGAVGPNDDVPAGVTLPTAKLGSTVSEPPADWVNGT
jgi:hypothetical protein